MGESFCHLATKEYSTQNINFFIITIEFSFELIESHKWNSFFSALSFSQLNGPSFPIRILLIFCRYLAYNINFTFMQDPLAILYGCMRSLWYNTRKAKLIYREFFNLKESTQRECRVLWLRKGYWCMGTLKKGMPIFTWSVLCL